MNSHLVPLGVAALALLFLVAPQLALRSAAGDDLFPESNQSQLTRLVRFVALVLIAVAAALFIYS